MPPETKTKRWKLILGYAAFSFAALLFGLYVTFPYDMLRERFRLELSRAGLNVTMDSFGPGFFGFTASDVRIAKANAPEGGGGLLIDKIRIRPKLFRPGMKVSAQAFGGDLTLSVSSFWLFRMMGVTQAKNRESAGVGYLVANLDDLDLSQGNLKGLTGIDFAGTVEGDVDLEVPLAGTPGPIPFDLGGANGTIKLRGDGTGINGGTVNVQMYGDTVPMDLPKIVLGALDVSLKVEKGVATIETLSAKSTDLEAGVGGTIKLARAPEYSELNLDLRFKMEQDLTKRLGPIAAGVSILPMDPKDPAFRTEKITGFLVRPAAASLSRFGR